MTDAVVNPEAVAADPAIVAAPAPAAPPASPAVVATPGGKGFEPTGHAGLDLSLKFFGGLGLSADSPEIVEASKGNFEYLKAKLGTLGDRAAGWEQYLQVAQDATKSIADKKTSDVAAVKTLVHTEVGGEETWGKIKEYVEANADPEELDMVNKALMGGGVVAKAMAQMLHRQYMQSSGTTVEPASATVNQPSVASNGAALTLTGYRSELNALISKIGANRLEGSAEYSALRSKYKNVSR